MNRSTRRPAGPVPRELHVDVVGSGVYRVTGGRAPHTVEIDADVVRCDCADAHYRRRPCKHLVAVTTFLLAGPPIARDTGAGPGLERDVPPPEPAA